MRQEEQYRQQRHGADRLRAMLDGRVWLLIALRFVNPTQLVSRVKDQTTAGAH